MSANLSQQWLDKATEDLAAEKIHDFVTKKI